MDKITLRSKLKAFAKNIVVNAENLPLKATAIIAWEGATFSDESTCTREIMQKLVDSVDFEKYSPPLLVDHDWQAKSAIIGRMTDIYIDNENRLIASFDILHQETADKIESGEWRDLSVTFSVPEYELLECSIVAVPAIRGARIIRPEGDDMKVEKPNETAGEMEGIGVGEEVVPFPEKADDDSAEVRAAVTENKPSESDDEAEDNTDPETEAKDDESVMEQACGKDEEEEEDKSMNACGDKESENACGDKEIKNNQKIDSNIVENSALLSQIADLKQQVANAKRETMQVKQDVLISNTVKQWVENGLTLPASVDEETEFLKALLNCEQGENLFNAYSKLKVSTANSSAMVGKRISYPAETVKNAEQKRGNYWEEYINNRLEKQKNEGRK